MKTIIFVRHAKSSWTDFSLTDFQRPLDERGIHDAPRMAKRLKEIGEQPDVIISSPALRAITTAAYFAREFGLDVTPEDTLYHGLPDHYLFTINRLSEDIKSVMLFGHNPGLTHVANAIKPGCTDDLPTCGIVISRVKAKMTWQEIYFSDMKLIDILTPKMLK